MSPSYMQAYGDAKAEYDAAVKDLDRARARVNRADRRCREEGEKLAARLRRMAPPADDTPAYRDSDSITPRDMAVS